MGKVGDTVREASAEEILRRGVRLSPKVLSDRREEME